MKIESDQNIGAFYCVSLQFWIRLNLAILKSCRSKGQNGLSMEINFSIIFADVLALNCFHTSFSSFCKLFVAFSSLVFFVSAPLGIVYSSSEYIFRGQKN